MVLAGVLDVAGIDAVPELRCRVASSMALRWRPASRPNLGDGSP